MPHEPCIRDMRISVKIILGLLVQGESPKAIMADYSDREPDDIRACLAYAQANIAHDRLDAISEELEAGSMVTVRDGRVRISGSGPSGS